VFVAVVRGEIARTEAGIQVGSTRDQLVEALGAPLHELDRARDPRLVVPTKLDNAHVLVENDRVSAIVLTPAVDRSGERSSPPAEAKEGKDHKEHKEACTRPVGDRARRILGACLSTAGELVRVGDEEIAVLVRDSDKVVARAPIPGLVFAAPVRIPGEVRDELVAIVKTENAEAATWSLIVFRMIEGKLIRVDNPAPLYQLTAAHARWVGADLRDLDLALELTARPDSIEAGGLLTTRVGSQIRDLVVISPVPVPRRRLKNAPVELPTAPSDAGAGDRAPPPGR
jgi:hypothetical protein